MKLDRNINQDGKGKYALLNLRTNKIEWGNLYDEDEFFVIKLKDKYARAALTAYANAAWHDDEEWFNEIMELAKRSGRDHPNCKKPD